MQPPPTRKGPYLKVLSNVHKEQLARLQAKNQHECDLLEDIKSFTKQRSAIEKSYAEALLKISNVYLNKKIPSIPDLRDEDGEEQWNVWNVWRTVLEENEKLAKARLAAVEVFQQQIIDDAKAIRQIKLGQCRKYIDQLSIIQRELQYSVAELDRNKKLYFEEEHLAHDVRDKARDVEEKMKKKKGSLFSSLTSLKRESVKVSTKKEACEEKSTGARNDYLIALAIANAHQDHYYNVDLDGTLRNLESEVYTRLKEYLMVLSRTELLTCSAAQNSFTKIRDQAQMLSREYNVMCCVQYYPVLKQHISYPFEPCDGDNCTKITCDHGAGAILSREAKRWAQKISKEVKSAKEQQKQLVKYQQQRDAGNKVDPDDPNGPDLDTKIDEAKDIIRRAMTEKAKAEGVIECLRDGDVNVDEWLQDVEILTTHDMARSGSNVSVKTEDSRDQRPQIETYYDSDANDASENREGETSSAEPPERDEDIEAQIETERKKIESLSAMTWDDPMNVDWGDTPEPAASAEPEEDVGGSGMEPPDIKVRQESWPNEGSVQAAGVKCVAIYTYQAANPDELSIVENEHLELMGDAEEESGWVRARNYKGEEGYVPQNYVEAVGEDGDEGEAASSLQPQISFSSVDYHVAVESKQGLEDKKISNGYIEQVEDENQNIPQEGTPTVPTSVSSGLTTPFINELRAGDGAEWCRALYDYEATAPEELSFGEGQIIKISRRNDDGWWEGEYDGITGVFPEIVVEECRWDGELLSPMDEDEIIDEDEISDSGIQPPCYTPPEVPGHLLPPEKVVVTQPTPDTRGEEGDEEEEEEEHEALGGQIKEREEEEEKGEEEEPQDKVEEEPQAKPEEPPPPPEAEPKEEVKEDTHFLEEEDEEEDEFSQEPGFTITEEPDEEEPSVIAAVSAPKEPKPPVAPAASSSSLDVAQIVITAATPMTDDHVPLPGEKGYTAPPSGDKDKQESYSESDPTPQVVQGGEDEKEEGGGGGGSPPAEDDDVDIEDFGGGGWANFEETFPKCPPVSSVPRVVEVEVKESAKIEPKKSSLEIEDSVEKTRISLGESNESPVTPEELDVQNLAKLESLKESDA